MVGTTGFEPATSRTPSERATRLRYVPKLRLFRLDSGPEFVKHWSRSAAVSGLEHLAQLEQMSGQCTDGLVAFGRVGHRYAAYRVFGLIKFKFEVVVSRRASCLDRRRIVRNFFCRNGPWFRTVAKLIVKLLLCPRDREHIVVEQFLDTKRYLNIAPSIAPLARSVLLRREHREFGLPVAKDVRLYADQLAHLTDLKIDFLGYYHRALSHWANRVLKCSGALQPLLYVFIKVVSILIRMRSEFDFIHNIKKKYGLVHVGDDCAVLPRDSETDLLVTADMLVEDVDFRLAWTSPELLGAKALAVSLSDIAAMGGTPKWAMLSIGTPETVWGSSFVDKLYEGWHTLARHHSVELVGGDVSRAPDKLVIDSMVLGEVEKGRAILRSGARPGDSIFVTGSLGGAAGGLLLLESGTSYAGAARWQQELISRQIRPTARVDAGLRVTRWGRATAMIDVSDGLSSDLAHICESSCVGARLDISAIPVNTNLDGLVMSREQRLGLALNGGEDFELLFTASAEAALPDDNRAQKIGVITDVEGVLEAVFEGRVTILEPRGFRHF